jgi:hypothetical protein
VKAVSDLTAKPEYIEGQKALRNFEDGMRTIFKARKKAGSPEGYHFTLEGAPSKLRLGGGVRRLLSL